VCVCVCACACVCVCMCVCERQLQQRHLSLPQRQCRRPRHFQPCYTDKGNEHASAWLQPRQHNAAPLTSTDSAAVNATASGNAVLAVAAVGSPAHAPTPANASPSSPHPTPPPTTPACPPPWSACTLLPLPMLRLFVVGVGVVSTAAAAPTRPSCQAATSRSMRAWRGLTGRTAMACGVVWCVCMRVYMFVCVVCVCMCVVGRMAMACCSVCVCAYIHVCMCVWWDGWP
jgi:hypothetical protein